MALNTLARNDITLSETAAMTDAQLLTLPNFGRKCLRYVRALQERDHLKMRLRELDAELDSLTTSE